METTIYQLNSTTQQERKICLIADSHNENTENIIVSIKKQKPDIIAICGDILKMPPNTVDPYYNICCSERDTRHISGAVKARELLDFCADTAPTFFSIGNHESHFDIYDFEYCEKHGIKVLDNIYTEWNDFCIGGLSSGYKELIIKQRQAMVLPNGEKVCSAAERMTDIFWLEKFKRNKKYKILLCHHPEYYKRIYNPKGIDLILSGHAHGGQIRLLGRGLYAHGQGVFPRYTNGLIDGQMIISRGLANASLKFPRLFNDIEIVYINLLPRN